jgi:hypothetical protein
LTVKEYREACNKGNLFDITLNPNEDSLDGYMADTIKEGVNDPYDPQDIDNPGADRLDTRKSRATEVGGAGKEPPTSETQPPPRSTDEPSNIAQIPKKANSAAFDRASYEADGGDKWIDERRKYFFEDPVGVDKSLWERAKEASRQAYGKVKWQFVAWFYRKQGGKFT